MRKKSKDVHPLIYLANDRAVNQVSGFATVAASLDVDQLCRWYMTEKTTAPLRGLKGGKPYFVEHSGLQDKEHFVAGSRGSREGRKEEHLAIALFNEYGSSTKGIEADDEGLVWMLDYQLPLKSKSGDKKIGKVDLLALTSTDQLAVVELKYMPVDGTASRADTPLRALLEGLAYCAILDADLECIHQQAIEKFNRPIAKKRPALIVLANDSYWKLYRESKSAAAWQPELQRLATELEVSLDIPVSFLSLRVPDDPVRYEGRLPKFIEKPLLERVW
jgi:hypothetical protein